MQKPNLGFSRMETPIVQIEGEHADHLTTTTALWSIHARSSIIFVNYFLACHTTGLSTTQVPLRGRGWYTVVSLIYDLCLWPHLLIFVNSWSYGIVARKGGSIFYQTSSEGFIQLLFLRLFVVAGRVIKDLFLKLYTYLTLSIFVSNIRYLPPIGVINNNKECNFMDASYHPKMYVKGIL